MKTVLIHKSAGSYHGQPDTEDLTIRALSEFPNLKTLEEYDEAFLKDAQKVETALYETLPGGTFDRLLGLMLMRKASHFRVSHNS